jgi:hypothetical protein
MCLTRALRKASPASHDLHPIPALLLKRPDFIGGSQCRGHHAAKMNSDVAEMSQTDLNRLKEIVIDPFHRVGGVRGHRHSEFNHEFG